MIDLYYWPTPNGHKVTMFLEEAGLDYEIHPVDISAGDQFKPDFLRISPNNRMPAIVDRSPADGNAPISVFESGAILLYLSEKIGKLIPGDVRDRAATLKWLFWQVGGLGPMAGQNHHFGQYAPEKIPYAIDRYVKETNRLYGVLDRRLADRDYIVGKDYSIADIAAYPWVVPWKRQQQDLDLFPNLRRWFDAVCTRPSTLRAYAKGEPYMNRPAVTEEGKTILFGQTAQTVADHGKERAMKVSGKVALVTGAGSGIGRATALALAARDASLILFGRSRDKLQETARLAAAKGALVELVAGDVTSQQSRAEALRIARDRFGRLDILINNAGNVRAGRLDKIDESEIRAMIDVDLLAPILFSREALSALRASGDAAIVNVSSGIALVGAPFYATYGAAKAGLARFGEALRRELLDEGVHVMTVYPGATETPMMATNKAGPELGFSRETPEAVAEALVEGLIAGEQEVIRANQVRLAMIVANRVRPQEIDERFRGLKSKLEEAVAGHTAL
jgi:GST-like protein